MYPETLRTPNGKAPINNQRNGKKSENDANLTMYGILLNNYLRPPAKSTTFDEIQDTLLICNSNKYYSSACSPENKPEEGRNENKSEFDAKKAMKPVIGAAAILSGGVFSLSAILKKSSKSLMNMKTFEQMPDLAINMNIREEPHFALYRAIRDPNCKNILGAVGVFLMSGIVLACKNTVDGAKEVWLKKQNADIEKNLQENLIEVETQAFSGKLKIVNDMMIKNMRYFDSVINDKKDKPNFQELFKPFLTFKGANLKKKEDKKSNENLKFAAFVTGTIMGALALGKASFSNLKETTDNAKNFADNFADKTIDVINSISDKKDKKDLGFITELLKSIPAQPSFVKEVGKKYNLSNEEISHIIEEVEEARKTIFADAPTALGGIPKKIQYYCYIDENRGHLYNYLLHPENKFTKYIFTAFTITSAIGYIFKQSMDALKDFTVMNENAKTELSLRKRLVDVEIANFKSKKESAIQPLVDNFTRQAKEGKKSKEELKILADNILNETKNGPPYVYT